MAVESWGFKLEMTERGGAVRTWVVHGADTPDQARERCLAAAKSQGWHNPRWYEYWRWRDQRISKGGFAATFSSRPCDVRWLWMLLFATLLALVTALMCWVDQAVFGGDEKLASHLPGLAMWVLAAWQISWLIGWFIVWVNSRYSREPCYPQSSLFLDGFAGAAGDGLKRSP